MENITYLSSGALNRAHFALVTRQEQGGRNEDEAVWETFSAIKARMTRPSGAGIAASIGGFLNAAGLHLQLPASGWDSKQTREDLLLLLYCRQSLEGGSRRLSVKELMFALPAALTLAEAGQTIEERRVGYSFCADVLPSDHEMQLLIVNTIRKDMESSNPARIILALDAIIASPNHDVIPAVRQRLEVLSAHRSPHVRRRVLHAFRILGAFDPEILYDCKESLTLRLRDSNSMVKSAALGLLQICLQNDVIERTFAMGILTELILPPKKKKHSSSSYSPGFLTIRAVEILGDMAPGSTNDASSLFDAILLLASKAISHQSWGQLLACTTAISHFPSSVVVSRLLQKLHDSESSAHPLLFLSPLLRSADVNIISVLLRTLLVLPVLTWAGGAVPSEKDEKQSDSVLKGSVGAERGTSSLGEIGEAELFGDEVEQDVWQTPAETVVPLKPEAIFPALFTEAEVGIIVGLLRSRDENIRKMTLTLLASSDPSSDGLVNQYLNQLLTAASVSASPETETSEDIVRRNSLVCQALQVAEVLSRGDGEAYAVSISDIILRSDNHRTRSGALASPTLSSKSRASVDTKSSGKGRGGTMEKAIEMVLTRARKSPDFFTGFSQQITRVVLEHRADEPLSITFLVIVAATLCEKEDIDGNTVQQLLQILGGYLSLTTPSIQETILLVMLRLLACLELAPEEVITAVGDLRYHSGRHIQRRCFQFLDQVKNMSTLRRAVQEAKPLNIAGLLRIFEATNASPLPDIQPIETKGTSTPKEESLLGLRTYNVPNRELRYQAYDPPSRANRNVSRTQKMRTGFSKDKNPYSIHNLQTEKEDASDLIELASTINVSKGKAKANIISRPPEDEFIHSEDNLESPFETNISTVLSDIRPPPFLSRTRSPHSTPPLSPGRFQRSPPLSPRISAQAKGSPSIRPASISAGMDAQQMEVTFDIRFDRLGTQPKSTARGWFEGGVDNVVDKLKTLLSFETTVVYRNGDDVKVQLKQGNQFGFLKLRQEEDNSTLWILRCSDMLLQRNIKEALM